MQEGSGTHGNGELWRSEMRLGRGMGRRTAYLVLLCVVEELADVVAGKDARLEAKREMSQGGGI